MRFARVGPATHQGAFTMKDAVYRHTQVIIKVKTLPQMTRQA